MIYKLALGAYMTAVIVAAFFYAPPAEGLGELSRIIYFHIPLAWVSVLAYLVAMVDSVRYLRTRDLKHDALAHASAHIGFIFTILATVTGAIFARQTWGVYWNWDPRQTSIFLLLLIYGAYFMLRSSINDPERRGQLAAVYCMFAFVSVPLLVFVVPRLYPTLHPDPIINAAGKLEMSSKMLQVFLASLAGFSGLYFWIYQLEARLHRVSARLKGER
ncbi:MAG TPA: cytochrome c biogenesis protein [Bacillota bacterium]|nr:cytochrome c biogenesis protein [Bacillota bacterium]